VVVEQKEPHAGRMAFAEVEQPTSFAARCTLARRIRDELEVPLPIYVDGMDDASRALFSDLPSPAFVIDRAGRIADKLPWADAEPLAASLKTVLARDAADPALKVSGATLEHRDAHARRLLAAGKATDALAWLDAKPEPTAASAAVTARAATTRTLAQRDGKAEERTAAIDAAQQAAAAAWSTDPARLLAARVELAEAAGDLPIAATLWRAALAGLQAQAPELTREWLRKRAEPTGQR